jgi:hydroxyacyl-ACP dehydratase HTD2-like protein with hotdog domain
MSRLEDLSVGDKLPEFEKPIDSLQMFRYSAITWNPHRIHYDRSHAQQEGHPDILVQAHLHGAIAQQLLLDWIGPAGQLRELSWRNVGRATAGSTLTVGGEITDIDEEQATVSLDVWTKTDEQVCADGSGTIRLAE